MIQGSNALSEQANQANAPLVLIVDDQASNRAILQRYVQAAGYRTCEADDGPSALRLVEAHQPDAVLLDVFMPGIDGFHVLRDIRSHQTSGYTPVIIVTAAAELAIRQDAYSEGADDFLLKPVDSATLQARLRVAIRLKQVLSGIEKERARFEFIATMSRELTHINSLHGMLEYMVDVCTRTLKADHGNLILLRNTEGVTEVLTTSHNIRHNIHNVQKAILQGAAGWVIKTGASLLIDDVASDSRWMRIPNSSVQIGSALIVPVDDADGPLGVVAVYHALTNYFTPDDQALIELVAHQVAGLIRQARLREEQHTLTEQLSAQTRQLELVNTLAQTLTSNLDLQTLYEVIEQQMCHLFGEVIVAWYTLSDEGTTLAYSSHSDADIRMTLDRGTNAALARIARGNHAQRFGPQDLDNLPLGEHPLRDQYQGWAAVPLQHKGRVLGILMIAARDRGFTDEEESLLDMARPHLAVALANAQAVADQAARQSEQAELRHLRNMAELAGQMAHHFNNLFAAILGNTQLAELDAVNEEQQLLLATVVDQVRDGAAMIRRLHLLKGGDRLVPPFKLDISETLPSLLEHIIQLTGLPMPQTAIEPDLMVAIHERELLMLCSELLSNAFESGGPPEQVSLEAGQVGEYVCLSIIDAGRGIADNQIGDVWRPFWTTHGPQRLGLGLPICAAVMWRIGGTITLTANEDGPGTTATLLFPQDAGDS